VQENVANRSIPRKWRLAYQPLVLADFDNFNRFLPQQRKTLNYHQWLAMLLLADLRLLQIKF
jgi:hypothetical protein